MKAVVWEDEGLGAKYHDEEIPADLKAKADEYRHILIEAAVEMDDDVMGAYLDGQEPDIDALKRCIRKAVKQISFVPVLCGSAFKNKGVQPLLDAVVDYLPSPVDRGGIKGHDVDTGKEIVRMPNDNEPFSMLGFKIMDDPFVGTITFCRVYSGKIELGTTVLNSTKDKNERVGRMLLMHANNREDIKEAYAGDIVALAGLKDTRTGDTLCDLQKPVILEKMEFPEPVIEIAIEPKSKADQEKLGVALCEARRRGPVLPRVDRSGIRPDHSEGNGRTSSRHQSRHPEAHLQGRCEHRRAAGRLSRETDEEDRDQLHPQEADRRHGSVRQGRSGVRAGGSRARGLRSNPRSSAARCRRNIFPASKKASTASWGRACWPASRLSMSRRR